MVDLAAASLTFSVLSFLLLAVLVVTTLFPNFASTLQQATNIGAGSGVFGSFKMIGSLLGAFSPDIALLSGFVSDIINGTFRYSVTSIIGILSVIIHWGIGRLIYGAQTPSTPSTIESVSQAVSSIPETVGNILGVGAPRNVAVPDLRRNTAFNTSRRERGAPSTLVLGPRPTRGAAVTATENMARQAEQGRRNITIGSASQTGGVRLDFNPCAIRGLGMFDISKSPMGLAALTSMFMIYMLDMTVGQKRSGAEAGVYAGFSVLVYGLNLFAYKEFGCYGTTYADIAKSTFLPIVVGAAVGGAGYGILSSQFSEYLPLDGQAINSPASPSVSKCNAPNDQDQFVCDAYQNGKRVSSSVVT